MSQRFRPVRIHTVRMAHLAYREGGMDTPPCKIHTVRYDVPYKRGNAPLHRRTLPFNLPADILSSLPVAELRERARERSHTPVPPCQRTRCVCMAYLTERCAWKRSQ